MRILLVTPPMVQVNAPYPATAYLAGSLQQSTHEVIQADASLMLALALFSPTGIETVRKALHGRKQCASVAHFLRLSHEYAVTVASVIRFLQGRDPTLAHRIISRTYLPEGPRFASFVPPGQETPADLTLSVHDTAVHRASLYRDDLTDAIREGVDSRFELARYGDKLASSATSFDALNRALRRKRTPIDTMIETIALSLYRQHKPDLIGFTLPFPGNVYGALRMAKAIKRVRPTLPIIMGGGYVNTELRQLADARLFNFTDYITLDSGEHPLQSIIGEVEKPTQSPRLVRTFICKNNRVHSIHVATPQRPDKSSHAATPLFTGLPLDDYFSMIEVPNPMNRIWTCGRWNKLMLAHGCYWHRCAFCDTRLDYIQRYAPTPVPALIGQIESVIAQTGQTGFHFIDEAMPPALLRALATELIRKDIHITWWGNIRFDKAFTPELAKLMAKSGCVAVTGGLEAATNRLLLLLDKGFSLKQATTVAHGFAEAGIMVHAYLMYGCPSQTSQDTVDSLEFVRQLFEAGCIQSAYWHRFALTVHSPIFQDPSRFGIRIKPARKGSFARNEVPFTDTVVCDHEAMGRGLRKALYNFMHFAGLDHAIQDWFDVSVPPPTLPTDFVTSNLDPHS